MASKLNYSYKELSKYVKPSEESPTGLASISNGKPIGNFEKDSTGNRKAIRVKIGDNRYLAHRVIWTLIHGYIDPELDIDHIDGNPWNNSIMNLRLVSKSDNQRNRRKMKNNSTGMNGVGLHTTANGSGGYNTYVRACWVSRVGKQSVKDFNIKNFDSVDLAVEFADLYRAMKIKDKDTYTERHGK